MPFRTVINLLTKFFPQIFGDKVKMTLNFEGFIKDVQYRAFLAHELPSYDHKTVNTHINKFLGLAGKSYFPSALG
jgi:hypothetical protein